MRKIKYEIVHLSLAEVEDLILQGLELDNSYKLYIEFLGSTTYGKPDMNIKLEKEEIIPQNTETE
jgi:hypothetical protein